MAEAITAQTNGTKPVEARRLHPGPAFFAGLLGVGLGYVYVGRIRYAIALAAAPLLFMLAMGWTRLLVDPVGWYLYLPGLVAIFLVQLVHPMVLAWSQPLAPAKPYNRGWWYLAWIAAITTVYAVLVPERGTLLGYEYYRIPSGSMIPTVQPGDRVVVDTWRYRDAAPAFGDIVVCDFDGTLVVKRVVGVPGDTLELRGPLLVRNGSSVDEPYLNLDDSSGLRDSQPFTLGADEFFVLGDYRGNSNDSRQRGPLSREAISGRVVFIAFSRSRDRFRVVLAPR